MSGRKNIITPHKLLDAQSLATSFQSEEVDIGWQDNVGIQIVTSGITDNSGQFAVEVTIDGTVWEAIDFSPSIPALSDVNTQIFCNANQLPFKKFRISFTAAGGTPDGTCDAWIMSKAV